MGKARVPKVSTLEEARLRGRGQNHRNASEIQINERAALPLSLKEFNGIKEYEFIRQVKAKIFA